MARTTRKNRKTQSPRGKFWGYHLIVNAGKCSPQAIRSKETIAAFSKELVRRIDMKAYGEPIVVKGAFTLKSELAKAEMGEGHAH